MNSLPENVIDANVKIGVSAYGPSHSVEQCLESMNKFGIARSIISCFTPPDLSFEKANTIIEKITRENRTRFFGVVRVDPRFDGAKRILRKFLRKKSFVAVSLNPFEQAFKVGDPLAKEIYELAEEFDCPVLLESGFPIVSMPLQVSEVAKEFRKVDFIMTHSGQLMASGQSEYDSLRAMLENGNLYCDTSQIILSGLGGFIEQVVRANEKNSRDRVIFGSNSPMGDVSVELLRVKSANIGEIERNRIFSENALKLFSL